jgi:2-keto-4-pentenoate hydratase/2-oxohepta-3-ene-1,7-dioic acid hydratase in catechol pathway
MRIFRIQDQQSHTLWVEQTEEGDFFLLEGDPWSGLLTTEQQVEPTRILAPVEPPAIFCIGLNYREHAKETGQDEPKYPIIFMKNPAALQHPGEPILLPTGAKTEMVDFEGELVIVIKRSCRNVSVENAGDVILGYTCGNDVSARDWQKFRGGSQWVRGKSFDTFAPLGPCIVTGEGIGDPGNLRLKTIVGGEVMQDSNTGDMIFGVEQLVSFISQSTTLRAGTVIMTGTPPGVGLAREPKRWLREGEQVSVEIENIGKLTNPVAREQL